MERKTQHYLEEDIEKKVIVYFSICYSFANKF